MFFNLALAALLGLGFGVVLSLLLEALDETITTPEDMEGKLHLPTLGVVPLLDKDRNAAEALDDAKTPFAEAYYSILTAIQFSTPHGAPNVLLVTSTPTRTRFVSAASAASEVHASKAGLSSGGSVGIR